MGCGTPLEKSFYFIVLISKCEYAIEKRLYQKKRRYTLVNFSLNPYILNNFMFRKKKEKNQKYIFLAD